MALEKRYVRNVKVGNVMKNQTRSELPPPCRGCYLVADPVSCENKECKIWREWFIACWDARRLQVRQMLERETENVQGMMLGGRRYYHPDYLRRYFEKDPCKVCWLAGCKCEEPCQLRRNWENAKEEVNL